MRKMAECLNCREIKKMAAHGLCYQCYRRDERAEENKFAIRDRHNPGIRREHQKMLRAFAAVMIGLGHLGVQRSDVLAIRRMLEPYVEPIAKFLASPAELNETQAPVNSEQDPEPLFTVRALRGPSKERVRDGDTDPDDDHGGKVA